LTNNKQTICAKKQETSEEKMIELCNASKKMGQKP